MPNQRDRQLLREAEGYLDLAELPVRGELSPPLRQQLADRCLDTLDQLTPEIAERVHALMLRAHALKLLGRYQQAIGSLDRAAARDPENIHINLALGWCHKRNGRIDLAIQALEEALLADTSEPILYYNLACYWSLARNPTMAIGYLTRALDLDGSLRALIAEESDFDPIRGKPEFQALSSVIV